MTEDIRKPAAKDYDHWVANIEAWSNWDGTVTLRSKCPIGRRSCVTTPNPPYDDCPYFMGIKGEGSKACCGYLLIKDLSTALDDLAKMDQEEGLI